MAGIKANQVYAGWGIRRWKRQRWPDVAGPATKIPLFKWRLVTRQLPLLTAYSDVDDRPTITMANVLPAKVPEKLDMKYGNS